MTQNGFLPLEDRLKAAEARNSYLQNELDLAKDALKSERIASRYDTIERRIRRGFDKAFDGVFSCYVIRLKHNECSKQELAQDMVDDIREMVDATIKEYVSSALDSQVYGVYFTFNLSEDSFEPIADHFEYAEDDFSRVELVQGLKALVDEQGFPSRLVVDSVTAGEDEYNVGVYRADPWGGSHTGSFVVVSGDSFPRSALRSFEDLCSQMDTYVAFAEAQLPENDSIRK